MIPKILHQTWKNRPLPPRYEAWVNTFKKVLPDWEYMFWDDQQCLELVRNDFPEHLDTYQNLAHGGQKADMFRYMAIYKYGGLYADVDCSCRKPLEFIEPADELIVCNEINTRSQRVMDLYRSDLGLVYLNWAFLAKPNHPVFADLLEDITVNRDRKWSENSVTNSVKRTGPHALTRAVQRHQQKGGKVKVVPASYFGACNTSNRFTLGWTWMFPCFLRNVYIRHHFETTWMDAKTKKEFIQQNLGIKKRA